MDDIKKAFRHCSCFLLYTLLSAIALAESIGIGWKHECSKSYFLPVAPLIKSMNDILRSLIPETCREAMESTKNAACLGEQDPRVAACVRSD